VDELIERQLIERSKKGDPEAFGQLMEAHQERLYGLAYRLAGDAEGADAVTQDTFVQAYRSLPQFKGRSRFMTWLYAIAVRKALDRRSEERPGRDVIGLADQDVSADVRRASAPGPFDALHEKELAALLGDAMMKLPSDQRAALALVAQEGLSYRDAAQVLSCPEGTVAWRVWNARRLLRDMLGDYLQPE